MAGISFNMKFQYEINCSVKFLAFPVSIVMCRKVSCGLLTFLMVCPLANADEVVCCDFVMNLKLLEKYCIRY
jgi:hypothetical protein